MRILALDIGTGTQDILLFDSAKEPENCFKMVMPSPTAILAERVRWATAAGEGILLSGVTMGGGPIAWALEEHIAHGLAVLATPQAARTLNDDLQQVEARGVRVVAEDDVKRLARSHVHLALRDLDLAAVHAALRAFDLTPSYDVLAVAVLDHGEAPPGVSDRAFRFDHIRRLVESAAANPSPQAWPGQLLAFAYLASELPPHLTRMRAVVQSASSTAVPLLLLDTGAAAALGALQDPAVASHAEVLLANVGNMHTLATHLLDGRIAGLFEHHTGFLTTDKLDIYLEALVRRTLSNDAIFNDMGHGCLLVEDDGIAAGRQIPFLSVTGPRRALLRGSRLRPYFAVPHGDMMLAGCFGLVRACAARLPQWTEEIERALGKGC